MVMIYLVDGHNLIPKIPGLSLQAEEDELQLIEVLQTFSRLKRKKVEVYFDRAATGRSGSRKFGTISAHFIRPPGTADQAIRIRLEKLGRESRNYCVVTSDRAVQNSARVYRAQTLSSESFAVEIASIINRAGPSTNENRGTVRAEETEEWLRLFGHSTAGEKD